MSTRTLLERQLRRIGISDQLPTREQWALLLETIERTYSEADRDRYTLERSIAISSREMRELYDNLKRSSESQLAVERDKLAQANRFLDSLIENLPDMLFVKDAAELKFVRFNKAGEELLGWPRAQLIGKSDHDFFPPDQAAYFISADRKVLAQTGVVAIEEEPLQTRYGQRWLSTKKIPIFDDHGQPQYLLGISEDVTEKLRRNAELSAAKSAAEANARRWKLFSDVAVAGAAARDYPTLLAAIAAPLHEALAVEHVAYLEATGACLGVVAAVPERGGAIALEPENLATLRALDVIEADDAVLLPILVGGELHGAIALGRPSGWGGDELRLCRELIPHAANAIGNVRAAIQAAQLDEARERLSHLLVHDLKSPLAVISCNLEVLEELTLSDFERREAVGDAKTAVGRLLGMIVDLLDIAQAEEGKLAFRPEVTRLAGLIDASLAGFASAVKQSTITLRCDVDPGLHVNIDPTLIRRMIENMLNNGLRYVGRGGCIEIGAHAVDGKTVIEISNDGPPIPEAIRARLFEKYGTTAATHALPNRGLGLYFCRLVAERHGGTIRLLDRAGGGVRFAIELPPPVRPALASTG